MIVANIALAARCNFGFTSRFYNPRRPNPRKINCPLFGYVSLVSVILVLFLATDLSAIVPCLARSVYRTLEPQQHRADTLDFKKIGLPMKGGRST
jgi:hypothetical protein